MDKIDETQEEPHGVVEVKNTIETEEVEIFRVFKKNGMLCSQMTDDCNVYELLGYLQSYARVLATGCEEDIDAQLNGDCESGKNG